MTTSRHPHRVTRLTTAVGVAAGTLAVGLLAGCGSSAAPATPAPTPTASSNAASAPGSGTVAHPVLVDGSTVNVLCTGPTTRAPTVVLVAGMPDPLTVFAPLQSALSRTARVCSYDRLGEGASAKPTAPQTLSSSAAVLEGVLDAEHVTGKVVVVGHSLGGVVAAQFAHQYAPRVAGVVLLDATAPSVVGAIESLIPASATGDPADVRTEVSSLSSAATNPEGLVYAGQPLGSLGDIPLTVVQHGAPIYAVVPEYASRIQDIWSTGQTQLAALSTHSELVIAPGSGHYIYVDDQSLALRLIHNATN